MNNIFKNSYFGKLYKTKGGKKAVFLGKLEFLSPFVSDNEKIAYQLWVEDEEEPYLYNAEGKFWAEAYTQFEDGSVEEYDTDIVSEFDDIKSNKAQ